MITKTLEKTQNQLTTIIEDLNQAINDNKGIGLETEREYLRAVREQNIETYCLIEKLKLKGVI